MGEGGGGGREGGWGKRLEENRVVWKHEKNNPKQTKNQDNARPSGYKHGPCGWIYSVTQPRYMTKMSF